MSTAQELDYSTLKWVKSEIDENLKQTRQALETYVENPDDSAQLRFCTTYLHQIYGTLQMVEIYGGALLAEEMEKLTQALVDDKIHQKDAAYDVIMRAILQLPSYLEHLEAGEQDRPVILLPLLNDLRAARGENLLSENAFFSPNLSINAPVDAADEKIKKVIDLPVYAKKLRSVFQSSLVGLYRGETPKANLRKIGAVFKELLVHSESANAKRLWWVSGGVIEALFTGGLESNIHIKQLISQIDGEIKRLIAEGDACFDRDPPTELLKNLLFYVATSKTGGKRVDELKKLFDLDKLIPSGGDISQLFERLRGSNQELMNSVSAVIKEDLLQIKDQLDIFVRSEDRSAVQLKPFLEQMSRISDTLAMLGLGDLHKILQDQKGSISHMIEIDERPNEVHLMEIASGLLYIEASLESIDATDMGLQNNETAAQDVPSGQSLPASERKQLNKLVLSEASDVLAKVKESFNTFAQNTSDLSLIESVPSLLNQVKGVLAVLMLEKPTKLLHITVSYISTEIIGKNNPPNAVALDSLADVITSVDYYLEAVAEGRGNIDSILDIAIQSIEKLGYSLDTVDYLQALPVADSEDSTESARGATDSIIASAAVEQKSEVNQEKLVSLPNILSESANHRDSAPVAASNVANGKTKLYSPAPSDEIDEEILEIFIEEADEILGSMHENLLNWKTNSTDADSLSTLRRSYHTIKGSGRLAGANVVGDFAWGIENILNKLIEGKLACSPELLRLMDDAEAALVVLIQQLKGESVELPDINEISARADVFSHSSGPTLPKHEPIGGPSESLTTDMKLVDIFKKEAKVHLETIRNYLKQFTENSRNNVEEPLMRAVHTLHGSAKVANAEIISDLSGPLDKYFTVLYETQIPLNDSSISLLVDILEIIEPMAAAYDGIKACEAPDNKDALLASIEAQFNLVKEKITREGHNAIESTVSVEEHSRLSIEDTANTLAENDLYEPESQAIDPNSIVPGVATNEYDLQSITAKLPIDLQTESHRDALDKRVTIDLSDARSTVVAGDNSATEINEEAILQDAVPSDPAVDTDSPFTIDSLNAIDSTLELTQENQPVDLELVGIFAQEAKEVLSNILEMLGDWVANTRDIPTMEELQRTLHTLRSGAKMAKQLAISELCDQMESALSHYVMSNIDPGSHVIDLFSECHAWLSNSVIDLTAVPIHAPKNLIDRLLSISEVAHTQEIAIGDSVPQSTHEVDILNLEEEASNIDDELVAIFLEEASELVHKIESVLDSILKDSQNIENISSLRRLLHTLKGGARMAGIMSIANVTHTVESVLEQIVVNSQQIDERATQLLLAFNEWINEAIDQVRNGQLVLLPPPKLVQDIESLIQATPDNRKVSETALNVAELDAANTLDDLLITNEVEDNFVADDVGLNNVSLDNVTLEIEDRANNETAPETTPVSIDVEDTVDEEEVAEIVLPEFVSTTSLAEPDTNDALLEDDDLIEIFLEEADEIQESMEEILSVWQDDATNKEHIMNMQRALHTLKGGARMAGISSVGDISHEIESMLEDVIERGLKPTKQMPYVVQLCHDWLVHAIVDLRAGTVPASLSPLEKRIENLRQGKDMDLGVEKKVTSPRVPDKKPVLAPPVDVRKPEQSDAPIPPAQDSGELIQLSATIRTGQSGEVPVFRTSARSPDEQIRVKADLIDTLVNHAGEMNIYNSRIEQQLIGWQFNLTELNHTVERLHEQLRKFEIEAETQIMYRHNNEAADANTDFDPLELDRFSYMQQLSRGMVESLGDLNNIQGTLDNISSDADVLLLQQSRINSDLHDGLMSTRLTPFSSVIARLRRIVRQTCQELGKQAILNVNGADGEMDRSQLNRVVPALEHILRNAVDHGLETPAQRKKANKFDEGRIDVNFSREGSEVVIEISDDGAGINIDLLRAKAIERQLITSTSELTDQEMIDFILESGFSTATNVTQISGRGVGMDVVNNEIKQLNGSLYIETTKDKGSTFTIRLPLTVLVNQALMLSVNDCHYALPLSGIEHIMRISASELNTIFSSNSRVYEFAGESYDLINVNHILHGFQYKQLAEGSKYPLILAHSGDVRVALHIDQIMGRQEIVIKSVGPQLSSLANISGATIRPNGEVALILDLNSIIRSSHTLQQMIDSGTVPVEMDTVVEERNPLVMIVDDSITVRKVTERLLKRHDFDTITAKDGVDALTVLLEEIPDVMLLDVEMPRMDGFELANTMRNDARLKNIPIIMITSRTGDKHRDRALKIGVNNYMGKPYHEQELLDNINGLIKERTEKEV